MSSFFVVVMGYALPRLNTANCQREGEKEKRNTAKSSGCVMSEERLRMRVLHVAVRPHRVNSASNALFLPSSLS